MAWCDITLIVVFSLSCVLAAFPHLDPPGVISRGPVCLEAESKRFVEVSL